MNNSSFKGLLPRYLGSGRKVLGQMPGGREALKDQIRLQRISHMGIYCHHVATFLYDRLWIPVS